MSGKKKSGEEDQPESLRLVKGCESWDAPQLASYFQTLGLGDYYEILVHHKITGRLAPLLTDSDLKEMGVAIVGDRLRFRQQIQSFGRKSRMLERTKLIWEGTERLYFGSCDRLAATCCGLCPDDSSTYKLTSNHLKIKKVTPARCGPIRLCCCQRYSINNYDLTHVNDVDVIGTPAPCLQKCFCCHAGMDVIEINSTDGNAELILREGQGDKVSHLLMNQIEECQVMERAGSK